MRKTVEYPLFLKAWDPDGSFQGYASVFGIVDVQGEEVARGAFHHSLKNWGKQGRLPKLLWQHDYRHPLGLWQEVREDNHGLFVKGQLLLELTQAREAYSLLKNGVIDGLSIGFTTVRASHTSSAVRVLEEVDLHEISLVTFAANPEAKVQQVKARELEGLVEQLQTLSRTIKNNE